MIKVPAAGTLFGAASVLLGVFAVWGGLLSPFIEATSQGKLLEASLDGLLFLPLVMSFIWVPGLLALFYGLRLIDRKEPRDYKAVGVVLAFWGWMFLQYLLTEHLLRDWPREFAFSLSNLMALLLIVPIYMGILHFLMQWDGIDSGGISAKLSRAVITLGAFFLWGLGMAISKEFSPVATNDWSLPQQPWLWPLIAAAAFVVP